MINFNKLGLFGRLGNQMFQIASTIGIAKKNGQDYGFNYWIYQKYFTAFPNPQHKNNVIQINEKNFHFDEYDLKNGDYELKGYFQSPKYWQGNEETIKNLFSFNQEFKEETNKKLSFIGKRNIAIHVRRGDYVGNQAHYNLPIKYYLSAIEKIPNWQTYNLVFFSDDMEFCKWHFSCLPNAVFSEGLSDIEDLYAMTLCDHFIIANSSFSWWGAYLGEKENSIVIRPKNHFAGTLLRHDIKDLYPENWNEHDDEKPNLMDSTFIIPVAFDHPDRMNNLNLVTKHLLENFKTNIYIIEQGGISFKYTNEFAKYSCFPSRDFHRTKMINSAAIESNSEFVINYDADVLLNPVQIWISIHTLRLGAEIVYPYDGNFKHVEKKNFKELQNNLYWLIKQNLTGPIESFGGAVFMNRDAFLNAGGENEKFISFGPEDAERYNRFLKLGLKVVRVKGAIYHLDHFRGINSSKNNQFIDANRKEWRKVEAMNPEELKQYVKTWKI